MALGFKIFIFWLVFGINFYRISGLTSRVFSGAEIRKLPSSIPYDSIIPLIYQINFGNVHTIFPIDNLVNSNFCDYELKMKNDTKKLNSHYINKILNGTNNNYKEEANGFEEKLQNLAIKLNDCEVSRAINNLINSTQEILSRDYELEEVLRQRRDIPIVGEFLKYCCSVATQADIRSLQFNSKFLIEHTNKLQELVHQDHRQFVTVAKQVDQTVTLVQEALGKNYDTLKMMGETILQSEDELVKLRHHYLLHSYYQNFFIYASAYQTHVNSAKIDCQKNLIPKAVIKFSEVKRDLSALNTKLQNENYELAVPLQDLARYFQLPIVKCQYYEEHLMVVVNVPLRRRNSNYEIFRFKPVPLLYKNEICEVGKEPLLLLNSSGGIRAIQENENCEPEKRTLCLIPRHKWENEVNQLCAAKMLQGSNLEDLENICQFRCKTKLNRTYIHEVDEFNYFLTNIQKDTRLDCKNSSTELPSGYQGSLKITLPCDCQVVTKNEILVNTRFPCDIRNPTSYFLVHTVPYHWINLSNFNLKTNELVEFPGFREIHEMFNHKWNVTFPRLNVNTDPYNDLWQPIEIPDEIYTGYFEVILSWTIYVWCLIMSVVIFYLWVQIKLLKTCNRRDEVVVLRRPE